MQRENLSQNKKLLEATLDLNDTADFGILKDDLTTMFNCALPHEELNEPQTRHDVFFAFRNLYNFLQRAEMYMDEDIQGVNIL